MTPKPTHRTRLFDTPERQADVASAKAGTVTVTPVEVPTQMVGDKGRENTEKVSTKVTTLEPTDGKGAIADPPKPTKEKTIVTEKRPANTDKKERQASELYEKPPRKRSSPTPRRGAGKTRKESAPRKKGKEKVSNAMKDTKRAHETSNRDARKAHGTPNHDKKREKKRNKKKKRDSPPSKISESDSDEVLRGKKIKLARDLRKFADGRGQFNDFGRTDFDRAADIFFQSGYYRVANLRRTQEHPRAFFIASLRKHNTKPTQVKSTRLALELIKTSQTRMGNSKDPCIEEVQIPREMARWNPSLATLAGLLVPDQEMAKPFYN